MKNTNKISIYSLGLGLLSLAAMAQENNRWQDYFAYNNIKAIKQSKQEVLAATSSGLFYYNPIDQNTRKMSKVHGLHEVGINAFDINQNTGKMLIGYTSGNLDVVDNGQITYVLDIARFQSFVGDKNINHINIKDGDALVCTNYGFSIFDLNRKEFRQSAFLKEGNNYVPVSKGVFFQDKIYIITAKGLYSHKNDDNISLFSTWKQELAGNFTGLSVGTSVVAATATQVFSLQNNLFTNLAGTFSSVNNLSANGDDLVVSENNKAQYFRNLVFERSLDYSSKISGASLVEGKIYAATKDAGMIDETQISRKPDGPYNNKTSKITLYKGKEIVKRNVDSDIAVDELINLLKENEAWSEPG